MRLTGGIFNGRELRVPKDDKTRPTQAKTRQALFNSIQGHVDGVRCLDLFAGSGALGFEALSRGASSVLFIDSSQAAIKMIEQNAAALGVRTQIKTSTKWEHISRNAPFGLVMADPPYKEGFEAKILSQPWNEWLDSGGLLILEWSPQMSGLKELPLDPSSCLVKIREKNYGDTVLTTFQKE